MSPFQYPIRRLIVRFRKVSKARDRVLNVRIALKFESDPTVSYTNLAASRLCEILHKDVLSDIETGPQIQSSIEMSNLEDASTHEGMYERIWEYPRG